MQLDLSGKTAFITGASSGLGAHFAKVLAQAGARVVLAARREDLLASLASEIGAQAQTVRLDVTDPTSIAALDLANVDILVNNAGMVRSASALDVTEDDWDVVMDTNLKGMFLMAQAAARAMQVRGRGGSIINIASIVGLRQVSTVVAYAVSKAGAIQLTKTLALEWARYGIRVNALAPGYLETELNEAFWATEAGKALVKRIPRRRLGQLSDLDAPLLLLASDASAYMTGSVLTVDGGHLCASL